MHVASRSVYSLLHIPTWSLGVCYDICMMGSAKTARLVAWKCHYNQAKDSQSAMLVPEVLARSDSFSANCLSGHVTPASPLLSCCFTHHAVGFLCSHPQSPFLPEISISSSSRTEDVLDLLPVEVEAAGTSCLQSPAVLISGTAAA